MIHAVILDMDGVIFDSERAYLDAFREMTERDGVSYIEQACIDCIGANQQKTREIFLRYYGADFPFERYYLSVRERLRTQRIDLKPGAEELLIFLQKNHIPTALASSTSTQSVHRMLREAGLFEYFDAIICGDTVARSKPDPEIFLTAAERLCISPSDCFVIEDSFNGIRCAHNAGMRPIMVPDVLQPDDEIRALCELVLPSLVEARAYFEKEV